MKKLIVCGAALLCSIVPGVTLAQPQAPDVKLEVVKRFPADFNMIGVGVAQDGTVFASAPATMKRYSASVVKIDPKTGALIPFPDKAWNVFEADNAKKEQWVSVPALWVDDQNHLWVLDSSLKDVDQVKHPPKLVEFDPVTGKIVRQYVFGPDIRPTDSLNDVRVDTKTQTAYITNEWDRGGLVVLDLKTGKYRLVLDNTASGVADPDQHLHIYGELARLKNGKLPVTQADGIAISPDRKWIYYRPLTDYNYWRISTEALRDPKLSRAELDRKAEYLGPSVMSGGIEMDSCNRIWAGDIENHGLYMLTLTPDQKHLNSQQIYHNPAVMDWADGFAISNGWLYISDSRLDEIVFQNSKPLQAPTTIFKMKLPACTR